MMTPKTFGRPQADFDLGVPLAVALQHRFWTLSFCFDIFFKKQDINTQMKKRWHTFANTWRLHY
jgi:hypothetical protein